MRAIEASAFTATYVSALSKVVVKKSQYSCSPEILFSVRRVPFPGADKLSELNYSEKQGGESLGK